MDFTVLKTKVSVSPLFFAVLTVFLLLDESGISGFAVLFSALHELGHFLALLCQKISPQKVAVTPFGICVSLPENLSTAEKIPVLMAGFTANFLLAAMFFYLNKITFAVINLFIGFFTFLPLSSTDGGSIFKAILEEFAPQKARKVFKKTTRFFAVAFSLLLVFAAFSAKNYFILIAAFYIIFCEIKDAAF